MSIDPDRLVQAYLGYRNPAGDLFWGDLEVDYDSQHGILPRQREDENPYPGSGLPQGDQQAESKTPGPAPETSTESRWPVPSGEAREKQRALPLPSGFPKDRDQNVDRFVMNVPDARPDSRYRTKTDVPVRTPGTPGAEVGNPTKFDYNMPTRRVIEGKGMFPKTRQREQRGKAKRVSLKWYKRNRSRHKRRAQRRQRRLRTRAQFKRQRKLRQNYPRRFERRPGGGVRSPAQRSKKYRQKKRVQEQNRRADYAWWPVERDEGMPFLFGQDLQYAEIDGIDSNGVQFTVFPEFEGDDFGVMGAPERHTMDPLDFLSHAVFDDDDDLEAVLDAFEEEYGPEVWDRGPEEVEQIWMDEGAVVARVLVAESFMNTFHWEQEAPGNIVTPDQRKDELDQERYDAEKNQEEEEFSEDRLSGVPRGTRTTPTYPNAPENWPSEMTRAPYRNDRSPKKDPGTLMDNITPVEDSGGASKVIPWDYPGENEKDRTFEKGPGPSVPPISASVKTADTIAQILRRTSPKIKQRSKEYTPRITGHDKSKGLWFFQTGKYMQRLRAKPRPGKALNVTKMDVLVSCTCPFWQWQGPEHWSKANGYLYNRNRTKGTAAFPEIRDPKFKHGVCKHVTAVFSFVKSRKLKFSPKKRACGDCDSTALAGQILPIPEESLRYLLDSSDGIEVESYLNPEALVARYLGNSNVTSDGESP